MLPLFRPGGLGMEPAPMARVEQSARTEDETYSAAKEDGDSESQGRGSEFEAQDTEFYDGKQPVDGEDSLSENSFGASPSVDSPSGYLANISFFA